ncbi:apolipoprotein A-II [Betta splendens]|uniref:Apolipoprotein A-II n=1 Tax=Betta splendens TaxID=158456 RepID=A0A8M1H5U9_BETSP|nr:apolipoprotein A-II [Betta splendens]
MHAGLCVVPPYIILARCELPATDNSPPEKTVTSWICTSSTAAEMTAKYVLALVLTLQVSMSLCQGPEPSKELVGIYSGHRDNFYKRLAVFAEHLQEVFSPVVNAFHSDPRGQAAKEHADAIREKPEFKAFIKIVQNLAKEAEPLVETLRSRALGAYEHHLREHIGPFLKDSIDNIKVVLDEVLPAQKSA